MASEIKHSEKYSRALEKLERTEELDIVLKESLNIFKECKGNYTIWCKRQECVMKTNNPLVFKKELSFVIDFISENGKCYQAWNYRKMLVNKLKEEEKELDRIKNTIRKDPKNHHAWTYRRTLLEGVDPSIFEKELNFTKELIEEDPLNNSAWSHRMFVLEHLKHLVEEQELSFVIEKIKKDNINQSALVYFLGLRFLFKTELYLKESKNLLENLLDSSDPTFFFFCLDLSTVCEDFLKENDLKKSEE